MESLKRYIKDLPVIPDVAIKIISMAEDSVDISFHELEEIIRIDTAITSKILKVANSALYAMQSEIKSLEKAISLLGFKTIKNLVLILSATSAFKTEGNQPFFKDFWSNSVLTAFYSREIAIYLRDKQVSEDVFLAGLIHRLGKVALYRNNPDYYKFIMDQQDDSAKQLELEQQYFDTNHKLLGAEILKEWSFPQIFIDCTREYGESNIISKYKREVIIVTLGDLMSKESILNKDIISQLPPENNWIKYLGIPLEEFLREKEGIKERVNNSPDFKECKTLFMNQ